MKWRVLCTTCDIHWRFTLSTKIICISNLHPLNQSQMSWACRLWFNMCTYQYTCTNVHLLNQSLQVQLLWTVKEITPQKCHTNTAHTWNSDPHTLRTGWRLLSNSYCSFHFQLGLHGKTMQKLWEKKCEYFFCTGKARAYTVFLLREKEIGWKRR